MKFRVTFKTPDALHDAIEELCPHPSQTMDEYNEDDIEAYKEHHYNVTAEVNAIIAKFVTHWEVVVIEFDTETKTATVVPVR